MKWNKEQSWSFFFTFIPNKYLQEQTSNTFTYKESPNRTAFPNIGSDRAEVKYAHHAQLCSRDKKHLGGIGLRGIGNGEAKKLRPLVFETLAKIYSPI